MKRILRTLIMLAALTAGISASAQSYWIWQRDGERARTHKHENRAKYSIKASWGGMPIAYANKFDTGQLISIGMYDVMYTRPTISSAYEDQHGDIRSTGVFSGEFNWNLSRALNFSAMLALCPVWSNRIDGINGMKSGTDFGMAVSVLPNLKLMYCNSPKVRVYSSLGLGIGMFPGFTEGYPVTLETEFAPIGIEVGRKWYGFAEAGIGTVYNGGRIGIGYQFGKKRRNHR